jgi:acetyl-CoA C-acetyltransferase
LGLYSTTPFEGDWQRQAPSVLQGKIDAMDKMVVDETPSGAGVIESYTVAHVAGRDPEGILIGRMSQTGHRFCAHMAHENGNVERLMQEDGIGMRGTLSSDADGINHFVPEA